MAVIPGLEHFLQLGPEAVGGAPVGLVTNHTGVDRLVRQNADLLRSAGFAVGALFGPEHSLWGSTQAGIPVAGGTDPWTGLVVHSLYGQRRKPTPDMLRGLGALVLDLCDIGSRYYTYPSTMAYCMEAAREAGLPFYVLDRPNPLGGAAMEGNMTEPGFESFVGLFPIPMRHGMTLGELARLFNSEFGIGCDLRVIACRGLKREMLWTDTGLPFVPPSPNATGIDMALLYAGTCLFEGTNWSEGRGTTRPFEVIGAPWADGKLWAGHLNGLELPGVRFRPLFFTPAFSKHQGMQCQGVQVHVLDRQACRPVLTGLLMLQSAFWLWPEESAFLLPERPGQPFPFDRLAGTSSIRERILEAPDRPDDRGRHSGIRELYASWEPGLSAFRRRRAPYLLYE